jgi:hypothetical protein
MGESIPKHWGPGKSADEGLVAMANCPSRSSPIWSRAQTSSSESSYIWDRTYTDDT